jgi:hypothetical protein
MSLITWKYDRPRRQGKTKALEQAGDLPRLLEDMIQLSEAHGAHETAAELRAQLNPVQVANTLATSEPTVNTPEPEKPSRRRKRKSPRSSSSELKRQRAWNELRQHHNER